MSDGLTGGDALRVDHVSKRFSTGLRSSMRYGAGSILGEVAGRKVRRRPELRPEEFWALDDVSFTVPAGEALGIVGANGAGKTSLLRIIHGISRPDHGRVTVAGRTAALIELGVSFDPLATGREAMALEAALHGLPVDRREETFRAVEEFAELGDFIDVPTGKYSLGMKMRLGYAVAASMDPAVLLIDEVLSVGDIGFQRKCLRFISEFLERGRSVVLVSHDLWAIRMVCSSCLVLDHGRVVAHGPVDETITEYLNEFLAIGAAMSAPGGAADQGPDAAGRTADETAGDGHPATVADEVDLEVVSAAVVPAADGTELEPGGPAVVRVELRCGAGVPRFRWAFTVTASGQQIPLVRGETPEGDEVEPLPGVVRLEAEVERLPLLGGTYLLKLLVVDPARGSVLAQRGWVDEPVRFDVVEPERFSRTLFRIAGVMVQADVDWNVDRDVDGDAEVTAGA